MANPCIAFRVPPEHVRRVERLVHAQRGELLHTGALPTRSATLRMALVRGLDALEAECARKNL